MINKHGHRAEKVLAEIVAEIDARIQGECARLGKETGVALGELLAEQEAARVKLADQVHTFTLECAKLRNEVASYRESIIAARLGQPLDLRAVN